ncbi:MAG: NAD(P)H-dependent oxidoreductase subunit E [Bacteroidetes bacterium]|nr:MAG: NAD(P)H-dependent oxidoreductase subunit E [Bacteroidota bacterium]
MTNIEELVKQQAEVHGTTRESLMPILQAVIRSERFLSEDAMVAIARELDISTADVFGTASFYTFMDTTPKGKNIIRVCKTITCHMKGKDAVIGALEDLLKIKLGENTSDGKFSLLQANCLGWCHKGPVMLINDEVHPEVTPESAVEVIQGYLKQK